jgi:transcriptional regulator with PAS, ATPase and Fis domain
VSSSTDTKPRLAVEVCADRAQLRIVFCVDRPVAPARLVRVPCIGLSVGRRVADGLRLDDPRISGKHASVRRTESGAFLVDDGGSKNGTFVNGERVEKSVLKIGDVISMGDTCLVVATEPVGDCDPVDGLVGDSAEMQRVRTFVKKVGPSHVTVLLTADTGCGKEVIANAIHRASGVRGEFVPVNCAAIPESLFESQFFGHRAGAFTGASASPGFFRAAVNGTLFLDEVGELPLSQQPKLLRAIQERAVVPLGETRAIPCPVRIVAATNRDLRRAVDSGAFREDLLSRLFETKLTVAPLRMRREDILSLFSLSFEDPPLMTHALAEALLLHSWPFNVREVLAVGRELVAGHDPSQPLGVETFRARIEGSKPADEKTCAPAAPSARTRTIPPAPRPNASSLAAMLEARGGNIAEVARELGRSRRQVYRWIAKYRLGVDSYRK